MRLEKNNTAGLITDREKEATKEFVKNFKHKKPAIRLKQGFSHDFETFKENIKKRSSK